MLDVGNQQGKEQRIQAKLKQNFSEIHYLWKIFTFFQAIFFR